MFIAMFISGTIGYFALESQQASENIVFARCVIGTIFLTLYVFIFKKYPSAKDITLKTCIGLLVGGVTLVFNWLFLFKSYIELSMGLTTVIYNTQPFILIILGSVLLKERLKLEHFMLVAVSFIGLTTIVLGGDIQQNDIKITGVVNAMIAATLYALSTIYTKKISNLTPTFIALCHLLIGCFVFASFFDIDDFNLHIDNVHNLIVLGLVHTGFMYIFLYGAYEKSNVSSLAIMSFIYPLVALIIDVLAYNLVLTETEISGVFIILLSLIIYNSLNYLKAKRKLKNA
ncbi:drug/metabolite transporter (DMT)-like permease [Marinomonas alcarazii]|uniref:Drug/metabolite transporter (DMT)-like permease n=2 Tax=Marinomonas alcarazii TaxID=491949 RepID=A0A318V3E1_9GAMM|nr:drug/metabolite transporter (DMT)-like permease [Marinomonas alcarazii]